MANKKKQISRTTRTPPKPEERPDVQEGLPCLVPNVKFYLPKPFKDLEIYKFV
jgi:hypothetical protein